VGPLRNESEEATGSAPKPYLLSGKPPLGFLWGAAWEESGIGLNFSGRNPSCKVSLPSQRPFRRLLFVPPVMEARLRSADVGCGGAAGGT
jgi:hypothetical protein